MRYKWHGVKNVAAVLLLISILPFSGCVVSYSEITPGTPLTTIAEESAPLPSEYNDQIFGTDTYTPNESETEEVIVEIPEVYNERSESSEMILEQMPINESHADEEGQPPYLTQVLSAEGLSFEDLDFTQLVLVVAHHSKAVIYCYEQSNGIWNFNDGLGYINGYVGRNGVSENKIEGDDCTPAGMFRLGYAFGVNGKPETEMTFRQITENSFWVDDPDSEHYNQWVEGTEGADWNSAEHLCKYPNSYAYAIVIEYNWIPNIVSGAGSAVFLHCGDAPTSGCIAMSEQKILQIIKWLSSDENPGILIATN